MSRIAAPQCQTEIEESVFPKHPRQESSMLSLSHTDDQPLLFQCYSCMHNDLSGTSHTHHPGMIWEM